MNIKKRTAAAATLSVSLLVAPVYAANWIYVTDSKTNADFYYDSETIQRSGEQVTVWEKADHSRDKTVKHRETKIRYRYDCAGRTKTILDAIEYYPDGRNESYTWETYEQKARAVFPDTVEEEMLKAVCQ